VRNKRQDTEEQPADREDEESGEESVKPPAKSKKQQKKQQKTAEEESGDESEFEGFGSDVDEPRPTIEEFEGSDQETTVTKYDDLLGGSSDEDEDEFNEEFLAKYRGTETVNLDDISVSGSGSEGEGEDEDEEELESITGSRSPSPLPTKKLKKSTDNDDSPKPVDTKSSKEKKDEEKKKRAAKAAVRAARPGDSTFLPTLMGGYISGSESASDIDEPPKKRRGQRARQAIWEKKYGASAKHLQKATATKGGRDAGWDVKRGAVGSEDQGRGKPWKRGGRLPAGGDNRGYSRGREGNAHQEDRAAPAPKPTKKDNEGTLHPSWEARKKAKEQQQGAAFAGKKIVFD
jgi:hypothetical protein